MVSILPPERTAFDVMGRDLGQALQSVFPQAYQKGYERQIGLKAVDDLQAALKESGGDINKIMPALAKAYTLNPNLQRSGLGEHFLKMAQAQNAQKARLPSELESGFQKTPKQNLPTFLNQPQQPQEPAEFFPTNIGPKGEIGNVPQEATTGKKLPLLSPDQYAGAARDLAKSQTEQGIPTTPMQAMEMVKQYEEDKKLHNANVDVETAQRVEGQEKYGAKAVDYLKGAFGNTPVPPEVQAYFQKAGEDVSKSGKSEAEKNRFLAEKAKNFANAVSNIKKSASSPRAHKNLLRAFEGTYKNFEDSAKDLRSHMQPILDAQLYDYGRELLGDLEYYPEEREIIVNPLAERSKALLNSVPEVPKRVKPVSLGIPGVRLKQDPNAGDVQEVKKTLTELKAIEPNFSLPLSRKIFEDKGYGWRTYKNGINELLEEGFNLEDDQRNQMGILDSPPLSDLERVLESLNLIGR